MEIAHWSSVLDFWFGDLGDGSIIPPESRSWFFGGVEMDNAIRARFLPTWQAASVGKLVDWETSLKSRLALILVLDQFSRHLHRGTPAAFAQDAKAIALADRTVELKEDRQLMALERAFLYLPFEHSEKQRDQSESVRLYRELTDEAPPTLVEYVADNLKYAERHREIIERFGRFPHRNEVLGRASTPEEIEFLRGPFSSF